MFFVLKEQTLTYTNDLTRGEISMSLISMRRIILVAIALCFAICTSSLSDARDCTIKVIQNGHEIIPSIDNKISTYKLKADSFRIEGSDPGCPPYGIFPIADKHIEYLLRTPLLISPAFLGIAEKPDSYDILGGSGGNDPATTLDEMIKQATKDVNWAKKEYKALCDQLKYCPTPAMTYYRLAPFFNEKTRDFAEFKRWTSSSPLSAAAGLKHQVVVYTSERGVSNPNAKSVTFLIVKPHILVFDFQPNEQMQASESAPKSFNRDQSVINSFQVMCMLEKPDFDSLHAKAKAMQMLLMQNEKKPSAGNTVTRTAAWGGELTTGSFVLLIEEMSGSKGKSTGCAIIADVPNVDTLRVEAVKMLGLASIPEPEMGNDGSRSYVWDGTYGRGTTLILRDYKPVKRLGAMLKFLTMERRR